MAEHRMVMEFPKKPRRKRQRIFKERVRPSIRTLVSRFYNKNDIGASDALVDSVTDAVIDDIIAAVRKNPDFVAKKLNPEVTDREKLLDRLHSALQMAVKDEKPFAYIER